MSRGLKAEGNYRSCRERVSQSINRRQTELRARANSWRVREVATAKRTEIEVRGDAAAAGDPGVASQAEVGARSRRACVKKRRSTPSGTNRDSNTRAVCGMRAQWRDTKRQGKTGQGKASERTFGLAVACSVGFATIAAATTTTERAARRAGQAVKQGATGMTHEVGPGYAGCRWWWWCLLRGRVRAVVARRELVREETDKARRSIYSKESGKLAN